MTQFTQRVAGLAMLGALLTACSDAEASGDAIAKELREAGQALSNWTEMKTEDFQQATDRALKATDQRIQELRSKIANSDASDKARATLKELEAKRKELASKMSELGGTAADKLTDAKRAVVDGVTDLQDRLSAAWRAFSKD